MRHLPSRQIRQLIPIVLAVYIPAILILLGVFLLSTIAGVPVGDLTRDPAAVTYSHPLIGLLSNLGILLWCATAATCLFTAFAMFMTNNHTRDYQWFLLSGGIITAFLLFDDFFLVHENLVPWYLNLGEQVVFVSYAIMSVIFIIYFREIILQTDYLLLLLAMILFATSLAVDYLPETMLTNHHLYEDGTKFLGIVGWTVYFSRTAFHILRAHFLRSPAAPTELP